jgi:hypothetical protein
MAEIVLRSVGFNGCISGACSCRVVSEWAGGCDGGMLSRFCRNHCVSLGRFGLSMEGMRSHGSVLFYLSICRTWNEAGALPWVSQTVPGYGRDFAASGPWYAAGVSDESLAAFLPGQVIAQ